MNENRKIKTVAKFHIDDRVTLMHTMRKDLRGTIEQHYYDKGNHSYLVEWDDCPMVREYDEGDLKKI